MVEGGLVPVNLRIGGGAGIPGSPLNFLDNLLVAKGNQEPEGLLRIRQRNRGAQVSHSLDSRDGRVFGHKLHNLLQGRVIDGS